MSISKDRLGAWADLPFFGAPFDAIRARLEGETFLPPPNHVFEALTRTQPGDVRVLILGQDPYPTPGHANGLAFSVSPGIAPLPRSLRNIFDELESDLGVRRARGDLSDWADQGVLLLNTTLTVPPGQANAHAKLGWSRLIGEILARLDDAPRALLLWGRPAQNLGARMAHKGHLRVLSTHPSPLSARNSKTDVPAFMGSRPFSQVNAWLEAQGAAPIQWGGAPLDSPSRPA